MATATELRNQPQGVFCFERRYAMLTTLQAVAILITVSAIAHLVTIAMIVINGRRWEQFISNQHQEQRRELNKWYARVKQNLDL